MPLQCEWCGNDFDSEELGDDNFCSEDCRQSMESALRRRDKEDEQDAQQPNV